MFPRLKDRIGTALDIVVEFSTLGEYRLAASSAPGAAGALAAVFEPAPRRGGIGSSLTDVAVERIVAGGAAVSRSESLGTPAATPAARRSTPQSPCETYSVSDPLQRRLERPSASQARRRGELTGSLRDAGTVRRSRAGTPPAGEQLCFADV